MTPHKLKWLLLLASSCYFYMVFVPIYILILGVTIIVDYFAGKWIYKSEGKIRKILLLASLIANIGVLAVFKYYNFLNENLSFTLNAFGYENHIPNLGILLPIGLSFHTFQAMSYTIEVYRGNQKPETHFGIYSLYVMFYPQLVAGPIERPQNLLHQFKEKHLFNLSDIAVGLELMLWGLFMKIVVADRVAIYVDLIYNNQSNHNGYTLILATFLFAIQIYCDFAGYSNMAIGAARVMGFNLMTNFKRPYLSTNISDFWKRWHISLSTWFKDYLYISLGGNKVSVPKWYINLMIVFIISGLWHGANWTYIIWGMLNGFYLIVYNIYKSCKLKGFIKNKSFRNIINLIITFSLVSISWVFFRSENLTVALEILYKITHPIGSIFLDKTNLTYSFIAILLLFIVETLQENNISFKSRIFFKFKYFEFFIMALLVIIILLLGVFDGGQFIYFQF